jgi:hypothetical protein
MLKTNHGALKAREHAARILKQRDIDEAVATRMQLQQNRLARFL